MALRNATLMFLVKKEAGKISQICLGMKKRGFGVGQWNGFGGKQQSGESVEAAAIRETQEECGVEVHSPAKFAELDFYFPENPAWDQRVHVYVTESWTGEPTESEEMRPQWFDVKSLPWPSMWTDDPIWLPEVLSGKRVQGRFVFDAQNKITEHELHEVEGALPPHEPRVLSAPRE
jgi:8-oxo-dGTP pyrophosphatase MutT (NUDIX family)